MNKYIYIEKQDKMIHGSIYHKNLIDTLSILIEMKVSNKSDLMKKFDVEIVNYRIFKESFVSKEEYEIYMNKKNYDSYNNTLKFIHSNDSQPFNFLRILIRMGISKRVLFKLLPKINTTEYVTCNNFIKNKEYIEAYSDYRFLSNEFLLRRLIAKRLIKNKISPNLIALMTYITDYEYEGLKQQINDEKVMRNRRDYEVKKRRKQLLKKVPYSVVKKNHIFLTRNIVK